jgi:Flp pilus assembly pilin Flp
MDRMNELYVRISERIRSRISKGQTMTEYALILSAIGVVVFSAYKSMGNTIKTLLTTIDGDI